MSTAPNDTTGSPGRLLRLTLQVYGNLKNKPEDNEAFAREYLTKVAAIHARNGIEMYQQIYTPPPFRAVLEEMSRRGNRGWVVDDHDITAEFYMRSLADLERVRNDPDFKALQAAEGPYVNLVHTVATLGWVERHVEGGKAVNVQDGKSTYPPWSEMLDMGGLFGTQGRGETQTGA
ncbi:hypothetical protein GGR54DRAFT_629455 [Hypoxylon sp. NC1633]|nr:hypothetical protein GGR54DRAFT_629455 [Hypoxylon sp. NC1633]